jgi:hypothetical protein
VATAQILIHLISRSEVSAEAFQRAVLAAASAQGLTPGPWSYNALAVRVAATDSSLVGVIQGGPFDGQEITFGTAFTPGQFMLNAFRQNVSTVNPDIATSQFEGMTTSVRAALQPFAALRTGFRTLRNRVGWDRDVPAPIALDATASSGLGWGVVALLGVAGLYVAAQGKTGLMGLPERQKHSAQIDRAKRTLRTADDPRSRMRAAETLRDHGYSSKQIRRLVGGAA